MSDDRYRWEPGVREGYPAVVCFVGEVAVGRVWKQLVLGWRAEVCYPGRARMGAIDVPQAIAMQWVEERYERIASEQVQDAMEERAVAKRKWDLMGLDPSAFPV